MLREFYPGRQLNTGARRRHQRQIAAMVQLANRLAELPGSETTKGLFVLLGAFAKFAADYGTMLEEADKKGNLPFLLHTGIERLLQEWSILSRACEQRIEGSTKSMRNNERPESARYYLEEADKLLRSYCKRWHYAAPVSSPYLPLQTPVAYFEKLYRISRALFTPAIPVISIPLSDYDDPSGWQAVAHEMGHHIFWNAIDLDKFTGVQREIRKAVADALFVKLGVSDASDATGAVLRRLTLWDSWLEETFADVCGVLFAGPAFALSAQDLAAASVSKLDDLIGKRDEQHPSLYLRPLIALQVVREVAAASPRLDYHERLLKWAGSGEVETQSRAAAYEGQLRSEKAMQTQIVQSGKRLPAELDVMPEAFSGDTRWLHFTAKVAMKKHPVVEVTMEELAGDVPVVVRALLYSPIWPDNMRLWDLIDYHGRLATDEDVQELGKLAWDRRADLTPPGNFPPIPEKVLVPQSDFERVLNRVIDGVMNADLKAKEKPRIFWTLLSAMNVQSDSRGYQPHARSDNHPHSWYGLFDVIARHKHDPDGLTVIWG